MVGTRNATPYGQTMCNRLVEGLAAQVPGLCIVSGLAFGIDVAAHRAALAAGVPTVAVLANSLPEVTPAQHTAVARDILDHGGALVTELHSQTRQNGTAYIARNRIIAGLSAGCIIVESPDSGGSLVTAHCADDYDRSARSRRRSVRNPLHRSSRPTKRDCWVVSARTIRCRTKRFRN